MELCRCCMEILSSDEDGYCRNCQPCSKCTEYFHRDHLYIQDDGSYICEYCKGE